MTESCARPASDGPPSRRSLLALAALVFAAALLALAPTLAHKSFQADDYWFAGHASLPVDPAIGSVWASFAGDWLSGLRGVGGWLRPVPRVVFALNDWLFGLDFPRGYHLTNMLLHGLNAALVALLAERLQRSAAPSSVPAPRPLLGAAAAGLFFAVHPPTSGAASWISGRTDLLATFFLLLATRGALQQHRAAAAASVLAGTALACLSKESGFLTPGFVVLGLIVAGGTRKRVLALGALSGAAAAGLLAYRWMILGGRGGYPDQFLGLGARALAGWVWDYGRGLLALRGELLWFLPGPLGLLLALPAMKLQRNPGWRLALLGMPWLALAALPIVMLPLPAVENDRFLYLPAVGFCLLLAAPVAGYAPCNRFLQVCHGGAAAGLLLLFAAEFHGRDAAWASASRACDRVVRALVQHEARNPGLPNVFVFERMDYATYPRHALQQQHGAKILPWAHALWGAYRRSGGAQSAVWGFERPHLATGGWLAEIRDKPRLPVRSWKALPARTTAALWDPAVGAWRFPTQRLAEGTLWQPHYATLLLRVRGAPPAWKPVAEFSGSTVQGIPASLPDGAGDWVVSLGVLAQPEDALLRLVDTSPPMELEEATLALFPLEPAP